jgi:circadian clock protein KaiC
MSQPPSLSGNGPRLEKVPSGIEGLDVILEGGFLQGGITIIQGKPGTGKTILGNQLCFNHVAAGGRALYVTLLAETHARMLLHIGNLAFYRGSVIPDQLAYLSAFLVLETDGVQGLLTMLRQEIRASKATLLVLDGLVAAETAAGSDMEFKKFVHELQTLATVANCAMFLLTSGGADPAVAAAEHTMVDSVIEMRSRLHGWRADRDLEILKRRGAAFLRGRHAFRISDAGITLFPRFEALLATPSSTEYAAGPRASTGLTQLDNMLDGGLPRPSATLLLGPSGSGKTTLGLHFLSQCTPDEPGLFFGCYEARSGIQAKAAVLGLQLAGYLDKGHVEFLWQPPIEALLDETCARLLSAIRARGVRRLFVDGLGGITKMAESPERVGHVFTALVNELRALQVVSIFSKESDGMLGGLVLPSGSVSDVADNVLLFQFVRLRSKFYRAVSTFKARDSRIDDQARLFQITARGIVVDDSPDRAEAIFTAAQLEPAAAATDQRPRGK